MPIDPNDFIISLGLDAAQFNAAARGVAQSIEDITRRLDPLDRDLRNNAQIADLNARSQRRLAELIANTKHQYDGLAGSLQRGADRMLNFVASTDRAAFALASFSATSALAFAALSKGVYSMSTQSEMANANLKSLATVVRNFGKDADAATSAAKSLASDGLMSVAGTATALKNVLQNSTVSIEQATALIQGLKDAASANPKMGISLEDQIVRTTEGIKLGLSSLTDNSGIADNLSQFYARWAQANGKVAASMTDSEKQLAAVIEMTKSALVYQGMARERTDSLLGSQNRLNAAMTTFNNETGTQFSGTMRVLTDGLGGFIQNLTALTKEFPATTQFVTYGTVALAGLAGVIGVVNTGAVLMSGAFSAAANIANLFAMRTRIARDEAGGLALVLNNGAAAAYRDAHAKEAQRAAQALATVEKQKGEAVELELANSLQKTNLVLEQQRILIQKENLEIEANNIAKEQEAILSRTYATAAEQENAMRQLNILSIKEESLYHKLNAAEAREEQIVHQIANTTKEQSVIANKREELAQKELTLALAAHNAELKRIVASKGATLVSAQAEIQSVRTQLLEYSTLNAELRTEAAVRTGLQQKIAAGIALSVEEIRVLEAKHVALQREVITTGTLAGANASLAMSITAVNKQVEANVALSSAAALGATRWTQAVVVLRAAWAGFAAFMLTGPGIIIGILATFLIPMIIEKTWAWATASKEATKRAMEHAEALRKQAKELELLKIALGATNKEVETLEKKNRDLKKADDELLKANKDLTKKYEERQAIVNKIAAQYPQFIAHVNEETGAISLKNDQLEREIKNLRDKANVLSGGKDPKEMELAEARAEVTRISKEMNKRIALHATKDVYNTQTDKVTQVRRAEEEIQRAQAADTRLQELRKRLEEVNYQIKKLTGQPLPVATDMKQAAEDIQTAIEGIDRNLDEAMLTRKEQLAQQLKSGAITQKVLEAELAKTEFSQASERYNKLVALQKQYHAVLNSNDKLRLQVEDSLREQRNKIVDKQIMADRRAEQAGRAVVQANAKKETAAQKEQRRHDEDFSSQVGGWYGDITGKGSLQQRRAGLEEMLSGGINGQKLTPDYKANGEILFPEEKSLEEMKKKWPRTVGRIRSVMAGLRNHYARELVEQKQYVREVEDKNKIEIDAIMDVDLKTGKVATFQERLKKLGDLYNKRVKEFYEHNKKTGVKDALLNQRGLTDDQEKSLSGIAQQGDAGREQAAKNRNDMLRKLEEDRTEFVGTTQEKIALGEQRLAEQLKQTDMDLLEQQLVLNQYRQMAYYKYYVEPVIAYSTQMFSTILDGSKDFTDKLGALWNQALGATSDLFKSVFVNAIKGQMATLIPAFQEIVAVLKTGDIYGTLGAIGGKIGWVATEIWTKLLPAVWTTITNLWAMHAAWLAAMGPVGWIIGACEALAVVGTAIAGWFMWRKNIDDNTNSMARFNKEVKEGTVEAAQLAYEKQTAINELRKQAYQQTTQELMKADMAATQQYIDNLQKVLENTKATDKERKRAAEELRRVQGVLYEQSKRLTVREYLDARALLEKKDQLGVLTLEESRRINVTLAEEHMELLDKQLEAAIEHQEDTTALLAQMAQQRKAISSAEFDVTRAEYNSLIGFINAKYDLHLTSVQSKIEDKTNALTSFFEEWLKTAYDNHPDDIAAFLGSEASQAYIKKYVDALSTFRQLKIQEDYNLEIRTLQLRRDFAISSDSEVLDAYVQTLQKRRDALISMTITDTSLTADRKKAIEDEIKGIQTSIASSTIDAAMSGALEDLRAAEIMNADGLLSTDEFAKTQKQMLRSIYDRLTKQMAAYKKDSAEYLEIQKRREQVLAAVQDQYRRDELMKESRQQTELDKIRNAQLRKLTNYFEVQEDHLNNQRTLGKVSEAEYQTAMAALKQEQAQALQFILDNAHLQFSERVELESQLAQVYKDYETVKTDALSKETAQRQQVMEQDFSMQKLRLEQQLANHVITQEEYDKTLARITIDYENQQEELRRYSKTVSDGIRVDFTTNLGAITSGTKDALSDMVDNWAALGDSATQTSAEMHDQMLSDIEEIGINGTAAIQSMITEWSQLSTTSAADAAAVTEAWNGTVDDITSYSREQLLEYINQWVLTGNSAADAARQAYSAWIDTFTQLSDPQRQYLKGLVDQFIGDGSVSAATKEAARQAFNAFVGSDSAFLTLPTSVRDLVTAPIYALFTGGPGSLDKGAYTAIDNILRYMSGAVLPPELEQQLLKLRSYFTGSPLALDEAAKTALGSIATAMSSMQLPDGVTADLETLKNALSGSVGLDQAAVTAAATILGALNTISFPEEVQKDVTALADALSGPVLSLDSKAKLAADNLVASFDKIDFPPEVKAAADQLKAALTGTPDSLDVQAYAAATAVVKHLKTLTLDPGTKASVDAFSLSLTGVDYSLDATAATAAQNVLTALNGIALPDTARQSVATLAAALSAPQTGLSAVAQTAVNNIITYLSTIGVPSSLTGAVDTIKGYFTANKEGSLPFVVGQGADASRAAWQTTMDTIDTYVGNKLTAFKTKYAPVFGEIGASWGSALASPVTSWLNKVNDFTKDIQTSVSAVGTSISQIQTAIDQLDLSSLNQLPSAGGIGGTGGLVEPNVPEINNSANNPVVEEEIPTLVRPSSGKPVFTTVDFSDYKNGSATLSIAEAYAYIKGVIDRAKGDGSVDTMNDVVEQMLRPINQTGVAVRNAAYSGNYANTFQLNQLADQLNALWTDVVNTKKISRGLGNQSTYTFGEWLGDGTFSSAAWQAWRTPTFAVGGLLPDLPRFDEMPAKLHRGEMILPKDITQPLVALIRGGGLSPALGSPTFQFNFPNMVVRSEHDIETLADKVGETFMRKLRQQKRY